MPLDLSNPFTEEMAATTSAVEAAWRIHEEREHWETEDQRRWDEEECVHWETVARGEAEAWRAVDVEKEAEAQKEESEQKAWLLQDHKVV
jgi:uncharacterized Zn finger protein